MSCTFSYGQFRPLYCLLLLMVAPTILCSQDSRFRVEQISTHDGLSQNSVYSILQDSHGYMWFGTRDGLDKYDGYAFRSYRPDPLDSTSISDYVITAIAEDSAGFIWAGTSAEGLNRLDRRSGKFVRYRHNPDDPNSLAG